MLGAYAKILSLDDSERLVGLSESLTTRIRASRLRTPELMAELREWADAVSQDDYGDNAAHQFVILKEGRTIPEDGIEFDVPAKDTHRLTKAVLSAVRRLHLNSGHPPESRPGKDVPSGRRL